MKKKNLPNSPQVRKSAPHEKIVYDAIVIDDDGLEVVTPQVMENANSPRASQTSSPHHPPSRARPTRTPPHSQTPQVSLVERLLSPQSLQIMMGAGGGVLVIGLVIWLWSIGLFDNPLIAAATMATGNLGMLGLGIWLLTKSHFKLAGRGIALLSSLMLPLNLWFYDVQGLISLDEGGHLWIPALAICGIFAATARVTRDPMFAFTLVGGVVLTGLLFLANPAIGSFWAMLPTSAFLMVVGVLSIHALNAFSETEGPFSKQGFGAAFYRAGHLALLGGIAVLASGHMLPLFDALALGTSQRVWSIGLLAISAYAYGYSHVNRPLNALFPALIIALALWAAQITLVLLAVKLTINLVLALCALGVVGINAWLWIASKNEQTDPKATANNQAMQISTMVLGTFLVVLGCVQCVMTIYSPETFGTTTFLIQMLATTAAMWTTPHAFVKNDRTNTINPMSMLAIASGSVAASMTISAFLLQSAAVASLGGFGPALALAASLTVPVGMLFFAGMQQISRDGTPAKVREGLFASAIIAIVTTMFTALIPLQSGTLLFTAWPTIGLMAGIAMIFFAIVQMANKNATHVANIATIGGIIASVTVVAQIAILFEINSAYTILSVASTIGTVMLLIAKALQVASKNSNGNKAGATIEATNAKSTKSTPTSLLLTGNVVVLAAATGSILFAAASLFSGNTELAQVALLAYQLIAIGIAWVANQGTAWKMSFANIAGMTAVMAIVVLVSSSDLSNMQRIEVVSLATGLAMVTAAYIGWSKEKDDKNDMVTFGFVVGSLLLAAPMVIGLLGYRIADFETVDMLWKQIHEVGGLVVGLGLLGVGVLSRVRSTTLAGTTVMATYIMSILFMIRWPEQLQSVSVLLMIGGGAVFAVGIVLSLYRDRILALPNQIREGKGVFSVMKWR